MRRVTVHKLIEKIEGEAEVDFDVLENGEVRGASIRFAYSRGIERILQGKEAYDALVITPRVCGICNHAHLLAAVRAIEEGYRRCGVAVALTDKAAAIREITWACELVQNHIKWFYLTLVPYVQRYTHQTCVSDGVMKATYASQTITKALALFAGQWPHSGYAVPGGVTCDPTHIEVMHLQRLIDETRRFIEQVFLGMPLERYLALDAAKELSIVKGDMGAVLRLIGTRGLASKGQSYDRFIVLGTSVLSSPGKALATKTAGIDLRYVEEWDQSDSASKAVTYKKRLYETGPIARAMVSKEPVVRSLHKRYKDGLITRVFARLHEVPRLLDAIDRLSASLRLDEPSVVELPHTPDSFEGMGSIEAARGSLLHRTVVHQGTIVRYDIITPTQWNLSGRCGDQEGVAVKAMIGSDSIEQADLIFRSFDVCSVCTTQ